MVIILELIGLFVVIKFCVRNRRVFMDRKQFCKSVANLRKGIVSGWANVYNHKELDDIVHNVLGEPEMENIKDLENNLAEHIVEHIKALKRAKEDKALTTKARKIIGQIKAELDEEGS